MKIGFYINSLAESPFSNLVFNKLNSAVGQVRDACLFYNDVGYNSVTPKFGVFNSTELWSFSGVLVATTPKNVLQASKIVNKFKLLYLFGEDRDFVGLIKLPKDVPVIVTNEADENYVFRTTGRKPALIPDLDINSIMGVSNDV